MMMVVSNRFACYVQFAKLMIVDEIKPHFFFCFQKK